ncbi:hypothetical protein IVB22_21675 [Bradyrhizobium sp. 190]|uniref:hypothetical protein n=1 Tax=Bradyrhizobium sp. 190 TaxID=2782658 RepID=UPI001FF71631|nr:hypothetical protein [Bradyrhizobium sp. 190]MCK1515123.1 hypothetical protein [Bradyrhizobium sp. 190]
MSYGGRQLGSALGAIDGRLMGRRLASIWRAAIFAAQALLILLSPAVSLARQPTWWARLPVVGGLARQTSSLLRANGRNDGLSATHYRKQLTTAA